MKKIVFCLVIYFGLISNAVASMVDTFMDTCENGNMQGCYQAGVVYWTGDGATKNIKVSRSLLEISCDGGFDDACVALRTMNEEDTDSSFVERKPYTGRIDGKLLADIDQDGKMEIVAWAKFASVDLGDYYQLLVLDDDGSLLWKGPREKDEGNPYIFSSLDIGVSLPQILVDMDDDGYVELLAPELQSDVRPVYYRKLRWRGSYFEPLLSNALMLSSQGSNRFIWKTTSKSYGTWISKLSPYGNGLIKANVMEYHKDERVNIGTAIIRFNRGGAEVHRWLNPIHNIRTEHQRPLVKPKVMGIVYGLDPYGDGFLSIRKKPNTTEIGKLYNGDKVEILARKGKWFKIRAARSGRVGWSHSNWIRTY